MPIRARAALSGAVTWNRTRNRLRAAAPNADGNAALPRRPNPSTPRCGACLTPLLRLGILYGEGMGYDATPDRLRKTPRRVPGSAAGVEPASSGL